MKRTRSHPDLLPCRLRVLRQKDRSCPSLRTDEKQESSVDSRAEGKPSGQTPAHSSPLPQSSMSRMDKCCSTTCWASCRENTGNFCHFCGILTLNDGWQRREQMLMH